MKKIRLLLCSLFACLIVAFWIPAVANAAAAPACLKTQTLRYQKISRYNIGEEKGSGNPYMTVVEENLYIGNLADSAVVSNVKSSNKNFQAAKLNGLNAIYVDRKDDYVIKDGTQTIISFTVKQYGKTYKLSSRVTFKEFNSVFKNFKLGNKDYASVLKGYRQPKMALTQTGTAKLQITPAAGYKIDNIQITYKNSNGRYAFKNMKNGAKISLKTVTKINVEYHTTKKPAYYKAPGKTYNGMSGSPLNYWFSLSLK